MINILVTLNGNYLPALKVMLKSMFENNQGQMFSIFFMYSDVQESDIAQLQRFIETEGHQLSMIFVDPALFIDSPVTRYYSMEMYYRLVAQHFLPDHIDRVLYLDPDIIVLNPLVDFYNSEFEGAYYIASKHNAAQLLNKIRLRLKNFHGYYNTGVLLINLELLRKETDIQEILLFINDNKNKLILPDQDVFNMLYWNKIKDVDCLKYNYDVRYYTLNRYGKRKIDMRWIKENTVFLHYCGKQKPWHYSYRYGLANFYRDYEKMISEQSISAGPGAGESCWNDKM